ncbi:hypothetical protein [Nonomuraea sp. NPDC003804]|uniref:hypothetical protein n=1 Tax=Nonomuraea sp. NPDC003804 TaxID=3154547 RepID=UPI0033B0EBD8
MRQHLVHADAAFTGLGGAIRRSVGPPPRRWLVAITVLAGLLAAVAVPMAARPADLDFATLSHPVQSLMSVIVPCQGILLVHDLWRAGRAARILPTLLAMTLLAAIIGVVGVLVCATALAVAPSGTAQNPWRDAGTIVVGSVLVQVVAGLVGTGLGLLLRSFVVAFSASIVLPMGLWFVLGAVDGFRPAQAWLAPYATVQNLLSGQMSAIMWAQWIVVFLLWGTGLNAVGAAWLKRRQPRDD